MSSGPITYEDATWLGGFCFELGSYGRAAEPLEAARRLRDLAARIRADERIALENAEPAAMILERVAGDMAAPTLGGRLFDQSGRTHHNLLKIAEGLLKVQDMPRVRQAAPRIFIDRGRGKR